jgi:phosphatidylserine/phosphatidylglycerophosphate/cardiolipin synthase-like enzyme
MPRGSLPAVLSRAIDRLSGRASLCVALLSAWANLSAEAAVDARELTALAGLSVPEERGTEEVLRVLQDIGLLIRSGNRWAATAAFRELTGQLATAFAAIEHYRHQVHQDSTQVQVVLTRPLQSVALEAQLEQTGWRTAGTEHTNQAFMALVRHARQRVVVMTPFLDERGAMWLEELLSPLVERIQLVLVLRSLEDPRRWDYPRGYSLLLPWLQRRSARLFNYSLPRLGETARETFHAKLILSDTDAAYVGSANITAASLENSMEMGVVLQGRAALEIGYVVEAILRCAQPWPIR